MTIGHNPTPEAAADMVYTTLIRAETGKTARLIGAAMTALGAAMAALAHLAGAGLPQPSLNATITWWVGIAVGGFGVFFAGGIGVTVTKLKPMKTNEAKAILVERIHLQCASSNTGITSTAEYKKAAQITIRQESQLVILGLLLLSSVPIGLIGGVFGGHLTLHHPSATGSVCGWVAFVFGALAGFSLLGGALIACLRPTLSPEAIKKMLRVSPPDSSLGMAGTF